MNKNKLLFLNKRRVNEQIKLSMIVNIVKTYNSKLFKYTNSYLGSLSSPKTDLSKIPRKYMSVAEYLNSKAEWKTIVKFTEEVNSVIMDNYLEVMMRNWSNIALQCNIESKKPVYTVIFSPKLIFLYDRFIKNEEVSKELNKHLGIVNSNDFYRLSPSLQGNIKSLFRLKKINPSMSYYDILNIFVGEFDDEFVKKIKSLSDGEISEENLLKIFN